MHTRSTGIVHGNTTFAGGIFSRLSWRVTRSMRNIAIRYEVGIIKLVAFH